MLKRQVTYEPTTPRTPKRARYETRYPRRKTPYASKISPSFSAKVRKVVERDMEHKENGLYSINTPLPAVTNAGWTASSISIAPSSTGFVIPQGTGQGNRIGNVIRTKKAVVSGIIHQNVYNATTNPQPQPVQVRMLIFKDKFNPAAQPASVALDLFQTGSTSVGPANDLVDQLLDVNRDRYTIYHDETFKVGFATNGGTGANVSFQSFTNNDFKLNCEFMVDITKFIPKVVTYNDSSPAPMNDNLWMIFIPSFASGGAIPADSTILNMSWQAYYHYIDA